MSNVVVRLRGMSVNSSSSRRSGGSLGFGGRIGGGSYTLEGRWERKRFANSTASCSVSARLSTEPLRQWMCQPPSSSLVISYPMACCTTGGPATKSCAMSRTITEKWPSTALAAPMPTTLPRSKLTTGTVDELLRVEGAAEMRRQERSTRPGHAWSARLDGIPAFHARGSRPPSSAAAPSPPRYRRLTSRRASAPRARGARGRGGRNERSWRRSRRPHDLRAT